MKVAVVAEYYPRAADPVLGIWAHRQACAARDAGAEVRVLVLHRLVPPRSALRRGGGGAGAAVATALRQPRSVELDGIPVSYVPFVSPPRAQTYGSWGAWAAPALARALRELRGSFPYDLVHAHYAVPAGDAVRRSRERAPLVISVHGGDVLWTVDQGRAARRNVGRALGAARLVLANSADTARRCRQHGAHTVEVVHLGTDLPPAPTAPDARAVEPPRARTTARPAYAHPASPDARAVEPPHAQAPAHPAPAHPAPPNVPTLVTVGNLVARKRHADVIRALARLGERFPAVRYVIVGDGPERAALTALAEELGVADRVVMRGALGHAEALTEARAGTLFVLPSTEEAFGVAYIEAMAGGVPAIGCRGEGGPEEIAAAGGGIELVPPRDPAALADAIAALLADEPTRLALGARARATVAAAFTWERCGAATLDAYRRVCARAGT